MGRRVVGDLCQEDLQGVLDDLNQELCAKIRSGELDGQSDAVVAHTRRTLIDKVGIANPRYAGLLDCKT